MGFRPIKRERLLVGGQCLVIAAERSVRERFVDISPHGRLDIAGLLIVAQCQQHLAVTDAVRNFERIPRIAPRAVRDAKHVSGQAPRLDRICIERDRLLNVVGVAGRPGGAEFGIPRPNSCRRFQRVEVKQPPYPVRVARWKDLRDRFDAIAVVTPATIHCAHRVRKARRAP